MRFKQIIENSTTAGSVATVAQPMMTQTRESVDVKGLKPVKQLMKGTKKKVPYANSIVEGKVKELAKDLKDLTSHQFQEKYKQSKAEIRADMKKVNEDDLSEQDLIVIPGQGRLRGTGFTKHDPDRAEHEGQTLKNSLHTIIRLATHLDKELTVRDNFPEWVSEKVGSIKGDMLSVMNYIISSQEMRHDSDAMNEGSHRVDSIVTDALKRMKGPEVSDAVLALKRVLGDRAYNERRGFYSFYVDQMVDMYGQQGVAEGSRIPTLNQLLKTSSPSPKNTYYIVQGSVADEEGRDVTVFNIYYNDKSVFGPYYNPKSATRKLHQLRADGHEVIGERVEQGVAEGLTQKYEMMLRNGQVKRFVAKDDADAKRIAAGHGAKSVIRLRGGVPAGKVSEQGVAEGKIDFAKKLQKKVANHNKAVVQTRQAVGSRVADIGPGGKKHNVDTDAAWDAAKKKVAEGAKVDRFVGHVEKSEEKAGKSKKDAESIAWATANKRGMLDNKNKKK